MLGDAANLPIHDAFQFLRSCRQLILRLLVCFLKKLNDFLIDLLVRSEWRVKLLLFFTERDRLL